MSAGRQSAAGGRRGPGPTAACAAYFLANVDLPAERRVARRELSRGRPGRGRPSCTTTRWPCCAPAPAARGGSRSSPGPGINAVGVAPVRADRAGFLALGDYHRRLRRRARHRHRSGSARRCGRRDGRGPATALPPRRPAPSSTWPRRRTVAVAVHHGDDPVRGPARAGAGRVRRRGGRRPGRARHRRRRSPTRSATMATTLIRRLGLTDTDVEVVLGGGTLQTGDGEFLDQVTAGVTAVAPRARVAVLDVAPVFGAVVEALTTVGAARGRAAPGPPRPGRNGMTGSLRSHRGTSRLTGARPGRPSHVADRLSAHAGPAVARPVWRPGQPRVRPGERVDREQEPVPVHAPHPGVVDRPVRALQHEPVDHLGRRAAVWAGGEVHRRPRLSAGSRGGRWNSRSASNVAGRPVGPSPMRSGRPCTIRRAASRYPARAARPSAGWPGRPGRDRSSSEVGSGGALRWRHRPDRRVERVVGQQPVPVPGDDVDRVEHVVHDLVGRDVREADPGPARLDPQVPAGAPRPAVPRTARR